VVAGLVTTVLLPHPDWPEARIEAARRGEIKPACHDGTPHAGMRCPVCGWIGHVHLSLIEAAPPYVVVVARCQGTLGPSWEPRPCQYEFEMDREETIAALKEGWGWP